MATEKRFRLLGRTNVFVLAEEYMVLDNVPCVRGITLDGKRQTCARLEDIIWL